jgi:hypothetical protein
MLKTFEVESWLDKNNTLKTIAEYESCNDHISLNVYLNERLISRISVQYSSIKSIVTVIETLKFNESLDDNSISIPHLETLG